MNAVTRNDRAVIRINMRQVIFDTLDLLTKTRQTILRNGELLKFCLQVPRPTILFAPYNIKFVRVSLLSAIDSETGLRFQVFAPNIKLRKTVEDQVASFLATSSFGKTATYIG